jgi:hypothetical protein
VISILSTEKCIHSLPKKKKKQIYLIESTEKFCFFPLFLNLFSAKLVMDAGCPSKGRRNQGQAGLFQLERTSSLVTLAVIELGWTKCF